MRKVNQENDDRNIKHYFNVPRSIDAAVVGRRKLGEGAKAEAETMSNREAKIFIFGGEK